MDIAKDITDAIEKQLPAQVGDVLRKRLEQAEADKAELEKARAKIAKLSGDTDELRTLNARQAADLAKHVALNEREAKVSERERQAEIAELKVKLDAETRFGAKVTEAMLGLVRNVEYRNNWNGMRGFAAPNQGGYGMQTVTVPEHMDSSTQAG